MRPHPILQQIRFSQLVRFGLVGLSGVALNSAVLWLLVHHLGLSIVIASAIATEISILNNFALNDVWTFRHVPRRAGLLARLLRFNTVALGGLAITVGALFGLTRAGWPLLPANGVAVCCAVVWNYLANSRWTWSQAARQTPGAAQPIAATLSKEIALMSVPKGATFTTALTPARSQLGYRPARKHNVATVPRRRLMLVPARVIHSPQATAISYWGWATLGVIVALGIALRFTSLGAESLWNDELSSWKRSMYDNVGQVIAKSGYSDYHPPGFQILLFFVIKLFGDSESVLRLPSALAGIASIGMIFLLGRRLYSWREGLIAAGLLAVCHTPIYYSQEARSYSLLLLFALITTYTWIGLLRKIRDDEDSVSFNAAFGYIVPAVACCYLHYYGLFLVALQGLCGIVVFRKRLSLLRIVFLYVLIGMAYLPWLPEMILHAGKQPSAAFVQPNPFTFGFFLEFLFNKSVIVPVLLLYAFLALYSIVAVVRDRRFRLPYLDLLSSDNWLVFWLVVPFLVVFIKSTLSSPIFTNRNMIIALPAAYLLTARGIMLLPIWRWSRPLLAIGLVALSLFDLVAVRNYYTLPQKEQFREAVQYVVAHDVPSVTDGSSMVIGYAWEPDYFNYYFAHEGSATRVAAVAGSAADIPAFMAAVNQRHPEYIWYVTGHKYADDAFVTFLMDEFTVVRYERFNRARVWLLRSDEQTAQLPDSVAAIAGRGR